MATNKVVVEAQKLESCRARGEGDAPVHVKILQIPAKCGPLPADISAPPKETLAGLGHQPVSSTVTAPGPRTSSPSVMVVAKVATPGRVSAIGQPQVTKAAASQVASMNATTTPGRTVVITVPRGTAAPQPVAVAPRLSQTSSTQLPANIQIPPGELQQALVIVKVLVLIFLKTGYYIHCDSMCCLCYCRFLLHNVLFHVLYSILLHFRINHQLNTIVTDFVLVVAGMMLIRSDSGQLMLVSQQALAQAQQGPRAGSGRAARILTPQVCVSAAAFINTEEEGCRALFLQFI